MYLKVNCPCGTRFGFDVEPENGAMPMPVACPACEQDATGLANQAIRESAPLPGLKPAGKLPGLRLSGASTPAPVAAPTPPAEPERPPAPASVVAPPLPPQRPVVAAPSTAGLRLSRPAEVEVPAAPAAAPEVDEEPRAGVRICLRHNAPALESCRVCGKHMCAQCMRMFGYVCSPYCQQQAEDKQIELPVFAEQRSNVMAREHGAARRIGLALTAVAVVLIGAYGWYVFVASRPKPTFTLALSDRSGGAAMLRVGEDGFAVLTATQARVHEFKSGKERWTVALAPSTGAATGRGAGRDFDDDFFPQARGFVAGGDVWAVSGDKLLRLDARTGATKAETPLPGVVVNTRVTPWLAALTVAGNNRATAMIEVQRDSGEVRTLDLGALGAGTFRQAVAAGGSVVAMNVRLVQRNFVTREAMKSAGERRVADGNISTGRSLDAIQDVLNDMQRELGESTVTEDESRYEVTLRRVGGAAAPDWKGEVIGPPQLFSLRHVDVVAGGKDIHVFDKANHKLWSAPLGFGLAGGDFSERLSGFEAPLPGMGGVAVPVAMPFAELGDVLYVFDAGTLAAFDRASGVARWRLPLVGVSSVQAAADGMLFVAATTGSPDSVRFSKQVNLSNKIQPILLKVRATDGRVVWQAVGRGPQLFVTRGILYAGNVRMDAMSGFLSGRGNAPSYGLFRLNSSSGVDVWDLYQAGDPVAFEAEGGRFVIQFPNAIKGYKFFSL